MVRASPRYALNKLYPPSQTRPKPCRKEGGGSSGSPVPASKPVSGAAPLRSTALSRAPEGVRALSALAVPACSVAAWCRQHTAARARKGGAAPPRQRGRIALHLVESHALALTGGVEAVHKVLAQQSH